MAGGGTVSDERITEDVINNAVMKGKKAIPSEDVPSLTPDAVGGNNEQEKGLVQRLSGLVRKVGEKLMDDPEFQEEMNQFEQDFKKHGVEEANKIFNQMFHEIFQGGITWKKIVISLCVGIVVVGIVVLVSRSVILNWILDFFKKHLLGWIVGQGGWIRCLVQSWALTEETFITEEAL